MKNILFAALFVCAILPPTTAQERAVKIDFESGSFFNNPKIPFDASFEIVGETGKHIEFVKANIYYENKDFVLHSFSWNRLEGNTADAFSIVVPPVLRSNTKYDIEIITYVSLSETAKTKLLQNIKDRVRFLLMNNIYFDGKSMVVNRPKEVYKKIQHLIEEAFTHQESKNQIELQAPSRLVLEELSKQQDFRFRRFFRRTSKAERNEAANTLVTEKIDHLVDMIASECAPFLNSHLVQHHRMVRVASVETDKEPFTLPVNFGMYAWNKSATTLEGAVQNLDFTPAVGITIPFNNKSRLAQKSRLFDSFGFSTGVLLRPVVDVNGAEFVTPGVNLPLYAALGFRMFKVVRFTAGVIAVGEKGEFNFQNLTFMPTVGLSLELNVWMGVKR